MLYATVMNIKEQQKEYNRSALKHLRKIPKLKNELKTSENRKFQIYDNIPIIFHVKNFIIKCFKL